MERAIRTLVRWKYAGGMDSLSRAVKAINVTLWVDFGAPRCALDEGSGNCIGRFRLSQYCFRSVISHCKMVWCDIEWDLRMAQFADDQFGSYSGVFAIFRTMTPGAVAVATWVNL